MELKVEQESFSEKVLNKFGALNLFLVAAAFFVYYFSNPHPQYYYNYTFLVAENFLHGRTGLERQHPSCLNEMIPFDGLSYSAFPLGSVLTMLPFALLKFAGLI